MGEIKQFTDLKAWQEGHKLVVRIYEVTQEFPAQEQFGLTSQLRRSAVSITSNIAEGFGRQTTNDKLHFYVMARASTTETQNQLMIARDIKLLGQELFNELDDQAVTVHKITNGLIKSIKEKQV